MNLVVNAIYYLPRFLTPDKLETKQLGTRRGAIPRHVRSYPNDINALPPRSKWRLSTSFHRFSKRMAINLQLTQKTGR